MKSFRVKRKTKRKTKRGGTFPSKKIPPPIRPIHPMFPPAFPAPAPAPPVFNIPVVPPPPAFQPLPAHANGAVPIYNAVPMNQQGVYRAAATGTFGR